VRFAHLLPDSSGRLERGRLLCHGKKSTASEKFTARISFYLLTLVTSYADDSVNENHLRSTYIGWTTKAWRRWRSHNYEITGGPPVPGTLGSWETVTVVDGFIDRGLAMQCEFKSMSCGFDFSLTRCMTQSNTPVHTVGKLHIGTPGSVERRLFALSELLNHETWRVMTLQITFTG
jgi:hypothetical protein